MQESQKKSKEKISRIYLIRQKDLKLSKNQKDFLKLELLDQSGTRKFGILWKNPRKFYDQIHFGQAVKIISHPIKQGEDRLVEIEKITILSKKEMSLFFNQSAISADDIVWLEKQLCDITNPYNSLINSLFTDYVKYQFLRMPAGKLWIFNYPGGLSERTKMLIDWLEKICLTDMDIQLLKTAVLIQSLSFINGIQNSNVIEYTSETRLLGLANIALISANKAIDDAKIDPLKSAHLKHLILMMPQISSGNLICEPQSREAFLLYDMQIMQQNLTGTDQLIKKGENKNRSWTTYNYLLKRFILNDQVQKQST